MTRTCKTCKYNKGMENLSICDNCNENFSNYEKDNCDCKCCMLCLHFWTLIKNNEKTTKKVCKHCIDYSNFRFYKEGVKPNGNEKEDKKESR